ncbi:MAG: ANTAR domain-containing protein [Acidimicrobiales bacterium]
MAESTHQRGGFHPGLGETSTMPASLVEMAGLLFDETALESLLRLVASLARATLAGVDEVSVSVVHAGIFETITATSEVVRDPGGVEPAEAAGGEGFAGVLSIPLAVGGRHLGALNLYSRAHQALGAVDAGAARVFADHVAVALANTVSFANAHVVNDHLRQSLVARDVINQAKGVLMREGFDAEEAFDQLRRASQDRNETLRRVAQELVDGARQRRGWRGVP